MKSISPALQTLFSSNTQFLMADLYTITLIGGTVLRYTSADIAITWNGNTYSCLGPKISRDRVKTIVGVQVDSLDITFFPESTDLVNGSAFLTEVINGVFDGAWVSLDRLFLTTWASAVGSVNMFQGLVSNAVIGRSSAKITVKSPLELLNTYMPRNVYQPGCQHNLFDTGCTLNKASFLLGGVVTAPAPTPVAINSNLVSPGVIPSQWVTLGFVTFTSGVLNGLSRGISASNDAGGIQFSYPFPVAPAVGDTFNAYPGCDHQQSTCQNKFNNIVHFRGFPYVPIPETAI
jgi:uncharacterized phage protein (TIGR02218 family)